MRLIKKKLLHTRHQYNSNNLHYNTQKKKEYSTILFNKIDFTILFSKITTSPGLFYREKKIFKQS